MRYNAASCRLVSDSFSIGFFVLIVQICWESTVTSVQQIRSINIVRNSQFLYIADQSGQIFPFVNAIALEQEQVDLFIAPRFLLFAAAICIDCIRVCNREQPDQPLSIRLISALGGRVPASNGYDLETEKIDPEHDRAGTVLLLTSYEPESACTTEVLQWLRKRYYQGARIVAIETGAYVLIQSGLLNEPRHPNISHPPWRLAAHYESAPTYREMFGDQVSLSRLYNHTDQIYSSAGAMSTMDLMLNLIEELRGNSLANRLAYVFNHQRAPDTQKKQARAESAVANLDPRLGKIISLMEASINAPKPLAEILAAAGVNYATARRMFYRALNLSPNRYYRQLRVEYAREMLLYSGLSISQIAASVGFSDASSFTRAYRKEFGLTPGAVKKDL